MKPGALGLDYSAKPADEAFARAAHEQGFRFAVRYLCYPNTRPINRSKVTTPEEVRILRANGIAVGFVWQDLKTDAKGGKPDGLKHGYEARRQAAACGAPPGTVIYFAVGDYDAPASDHGVIADYLAGVAQVIGPYRVGGYGKNLIGAEMRQRGLVEAWWQSYGFSRPIGHIEPWAALYQRRQQVTIRGVTCDVNEARRPDIGAWEIGDTMTGIRTRQEWGATVPLRHDDAGVTTMMTLPAKGLFLHHSVTAVTDDADADFRAIEAVGKSRFGYLSYSYMSHPSGVLAEGAGTSIGAHTEGRNSTTFGLVFVGNYDFIDLAPAQLEDARWLYHHLIEVGALVPDAFIEMHRDVKATDCPGDNIARRFAEIKAYMQGEPAAPPAAPTITDYPEDKMRRIDTSVTTDVSGRGYVDLDVPALAVVNVVFNGQDPAKNGYKPIADWNRLDVGGKARIVIEEAIATGRVDISVWVATA